jgi:hypothetical protein
MFVQPEFKFVQHAHAIVFVLVFQFQQLAEYSFAVFKPESEPKPEPEPKQQLLPEPAAIVSQFPWPLQQYSQQQLANLG